MNETLKSYEGRCLCGAVRIKAASQRPKMRACHCDMCRQQNSGAFMSLQFDQDSIMVNGPVTVYGSSEWAERAFCPACGSTLWYSTKHDGNRYLAAGLFPNAADAELFQEFFTDMCPTGYALAGGHSKLSTAETLALFAPNEGDVS